MLVFNDIKDFHVNENWSPGESRACWPWWTCLLRQASSTLFSSCLKTASSVGAGTTLLARLVLQCTLRMLPESEELSWKHQQVADEMRRKIKATQTPCDPTARAAQQAIVRLRVSAPCATSPMHTVTSKSVSVQSRELRAAWLQDAVTCMGTPSCSPCPRSKLDPAGQWGRDPTPAKWRHRSSCAGV